MKYLNLFIIFALTTGCLSFVPVVVRAEQDTVIISNSVFSTSQTGGLSGVDGKDGQPGRDGEDGQPGAAGQSVIKGSGSASVRIYSEVNGQPVIDIATMTSAVAEKPIKAKAQFNFASDQDHSNSEDLNQQLSEDEKAAWSEWLESIRLILLAYVNQLF